MTFCSCSTWFSTVCGPSRLRRSRASRVADTAYFRGLVRNGVLAEPDKRLLVEHGVPERWLTIPDAPFRRRNRGAKRFLQQLLTDIAVGRIPAIIEEDA
ncbi:hypothetical protein [Bifidobacterium miconisargentati]|uniref:hypothetical protein n=1 Tax=Bifidobacterium miconisargentati TaxID=2834437 RepID=UPI001BDC1EEA|nr:hypothetical protein [Bifidobacterium miconisargentati]MBW3091213.1 hypothetical protein [Bifidobacterium miconisargentati]